MASQRPPWFRFPNIGTIRAPAPAPQPPIVRPTIQVRAPPPPPSQPVPPAAPSPKKSPTPSPVQQRSPEVVATRSSPPKEQVPTPPPLARSSPANKTQQVVSPRHSLSPPPPPSSPVHRAKPDSPPVPLNTTATINANGSVKAATPVTLSPKGVVKPQSPLIFEKTSTPIQSPKAEDRPLSQSHHPSPLKLPPAHINSSTADDRQETTKFEQKNVLVQDTISKPDKMHHGIPNSVNHNHNTVAANGKQVTKEKAASGKKQPDRAGTRMITLAGENKGAVMELTSGPNSPNSQREKKSNKIFAGKPRMLYKEKKNPQDGDHSSSESGKEAGENLIKDKTGRAIPKLHQSPPMNAILNSNVQGINNSIVLHANCRHNDPGVHFSLARKANGSNSKEHSNQYHHQG